MEELKAICFDLDDTLWDLTPVIPRAEQALYDWYGVNYPAVADMFAPEDILALRQQVAKEFPELRHDLTELRLRVLRMIAVRSGYSAAIAADAFDVFQLARNQVELFGDVVPALQKLARSYRLLSLSNGNADLAAIGIGHYFHGSYSAREIGVAKPDAAIFMAVCTSENLAPAQVLHVGDHPENDIVAARRAGMRTAWVNRNDSDWPDCHAKPDRMVACLEELAEFLVNEAKL